MKNLLFLLLLISAQLFAQEGRLIPNPIRNIPKWVRNEFSARHLDETYSVGYELYPYYLRGDFNGDSRHDVVIQIIEKKTGKVGLAIFHAKKPQALTIPIAIICAGNSIAGDGNDLKLVNFWNLFERRKALNKRSLPEFDGDGILIGKRDSTNALIYWDGKKYSFHRMKE